MPECHHDRKNDSKLWGWVAQWSLQELQLAAALQVSAAPFLTLNASLIHPGEWWMKWHFIRNLEWHFSWPRLVPFAPSCGLFKNDNKTGAVVASTIGESTHQNGALCPHVILEALDVCLPAWVTELGLLCPSGLRCYLIKNINENENKEENQIQSYSFYLYFILTWS